MQVCFKYRGVTLTELDAPGNLSTDGTRVYKEYFLTGGALLDSYAEYVRHTFYPGASPGVHFIVVAPQEKLSVDEMVKLADRLANQFAQICQKQTATDGARPR